MTVERPGEVALDGVSNAADRRTRFLADDLPHSVWTARPDGRLDYVNARWREYIGLALDDLGGPWWETAVHPDDLRPCLDRWRRAAETGDPYEAACRLKRADGIYHWHLCRAEPLRDADGHIVQWLGTSTDIDDQKTSEESRRLTILETALDAIITMDAAGCIVEFNPAAVQIFGYPRDTAVGQKLADLIIPPNLREQHRIGLATYLATGKGSVIGRRIEITAMRADGTVFPTELAITRVPLDGPPLFTGYLRDIGDRVRMDEERAALFAQVLERAAQLDATFDAMTDAVVVYDGEGRLMQGNDAIHALFDVDVEAAIGRDLSDQPILLYTPLDQEGQPLPRDDWPRHRILRGEVLTGAHAVDTRGFVRDERFVQLNVTGAPLRDANGHIVGGVMVMRDVTERRRLEQRTRAALDALLAMAEVLIGGAAQTPFAPDESGREPKTWVVAQRLVELIRDVLGCRRVSLSTLDSMTGALHPLAITGLSQEEERAWMGRTETQRLDAADPDLVARLRAGEVVPIDMEQPPYRDRPNPLGARVVLMALLRIESQTVGALALDHGGEEHQYTPDEISLTSAVAKLAAVVIERDRLLREREDAHASEEALREANRRMDEFLGIAGHEMRTPLTTIKGNLQLAQRRLNRVLKHPEPSDLIGGLDDVQHLLDRTEAQLHRLDRLVDDVLDVSRIRAGHLQIRRAPCDLAPIAYDIVDEQRQHVGARTILLQGGDRTIMVDIDADRIGQVLTNYLTNALKYSDASRPVTIGFDVTSDMVRVWVHDDGPGIASDDQERIWERFYRVAETEHRHGSSVGLGMGLHISRTIIAQHGGEVGVESLVGQGATFWFTLPLLGDG